MNTRGLSRCVQSLSLKNLFFFHRSVFVCKDSAACFRNFCCKDRANSATFQKFWNFFCLFKNILYLCTAKMVEYATVFAVELVKTDRNGYSKRSICKRIAEQTMER